MSDKAYFLLFVDQPAHPCTIFAAPVLFTAISFKRERIGSVVECLPRDQRAAGSSLTGVTVLCP